MWQAFVAVPVLVKVLGSLMLILAVYRLSRSLVAGVTAGTVLLAVWTGEPAGVLAGIAWARFASVDNLLLLAVITLVIWLSSQMAETGMMEDLVASVRARAGKRTSMALLPAVIGLLPMPGGALFSAPMLDRVDADGRVEPIVKTYVNYWFRHVWEFWWPLYAGVLLAAAITGLDLWEFMVLQVPLTLIMLGAGYLFLLRRVHATSMPEGRERPDRPGIAKLVAPIVVVIGCYAVARVGWYGLRRGVPEVPPLRDLGLKFLPMAIGLVVAMATVQIERPLSWRRWKGIVLSKRVLLLVVLVAIIRIFGALIELKLSGGTTLAGQMHQEVERWGIPILAIIMLIPFVTGLTTGVCVGMVGASFPIVVHLVGAGAGKGELLAATVLAYGTGYMGMMLSPIHVCLIVTNEHFRTRLAHSIRGLLPVAAAVVAGVLVYHFLLRWLWP